MKKRRIVLAVTGASGMVYARSLIRALVGRDDTELHLVFTDAARRVLAIEQCAAPEELARGAHAVYDENDIAAPPASGSWQHAGMIVCPCSMASLAAIASGYGHNLVHRAADVALKEGSPLVLVPRETPYSAIHLENMLAAKRAGARIVPASPGFYHRPETIEDLADHIAGKVLDQLDIPHTLYARWGEEEG